MNKKEIIEFADGYAEAQISMGKLSEEEKTGFIKGFVKFGILKITQLLSKLFLYKLYYQG
jgi:hypothetical protein